MGKYLHVLLQILLKIYKVVNILQFNCHHLALFLNQLHHDLLYLRILGIDCQLILQYILNTFYDKVKLRHIHALPLQNYSNLLHDSIESTFFFLLLQHLRRLYYLSRHQDVRRQLIPQMSKQKVQCLLLLMLTLFHSDGCCS